MMILVCALVGVKKNAFSVDIDASESVDELRKVIKKEKPSQLTCNANELQVFLAKKGDNTWLDRDGAEAVTLNEHGFPAGFTDMDPLLWLKNPKNFGDSFEPNEGEIHVLVVVSKSVVSAAPIPLTAEQLKMVVHEALKERDEKASAYSFSDLKTEMKQRIVKKMHLTETVPMNINEPKDTSIPGYPWIPRFSENEQSQISGYMAYL
nr:crinkler 22 [Plasmopara viticola]